MLFARFLAIACASALNMACSDNPLSSTTVSATRAVSATSGGAATCAGGVFADTTRRGDVDHSGTLGLMRLRAVEVDIAAVRRSADTRTPLTLNIFPDACLVAQVTSVSHDEQGRLIWTGADAGGGEGVTVTLVAADDFVIGSAVGSRSLYQVKYAGNGVHVVMQINPAAFPPD